MVASADQRVDRLPSRALAGMFESLELAVTFAAVMDILVCAKAETDARARVDKTIARIRRE